MAVCPTCAAHVAAGAAWCGLCYARLLVTAQDGDRTGLEVPALVGSGADWSSNASATGRAGSDLGSPAPSPRNLPGLGWLAPDAPPGRVGAAPLARSRLPLVLAGIGIGVLGQLAAWLLTRSARVEPDAAVRYGIVLTLLVYLTVGALVVTHLRRSGQRLRWSSGAPLPGVALGLATGGTLAGALLVLIRAATGSWQSDPRVQMLVSEGTLDRIVVAVGVTVLAAPLIEEVLFRGIFAESLRPRGRAAAIWLSALAFSAWHLNPAALRYYALMGGLLGWLYCTRGLVCSIAAHAAFNGLLTAVAVLSVTGVAHTYAGGGLQLRAPGDWHVDQAAAQRFPIALDGPSGSGLVVRRLYAPDPLPSAANLEAQLSAGTFPLVSAGSVERATARTVPLPAGTAAVVDFRVGGEHGSIVLLPTGGALYLISYGTAGSARAMSDLSQILASIRVG
ncbi:MAG TPA: type II CAAX endopeptidase family protein [Mycobacteriales bacterium]|nr:type II CAAX endopeptidase family protein [Mycobacteriales bacterium]